MKILILILALLTLVFNLWAYKSMFKGSARATEEFRESMDAIPKKDQRAAKYVLGAYAFFLSLLVLLFEIAAANYFLQQQEPWFAVYGALTALFMIINWFRLFKVFATNTIKKSWTRFITIPLDTVFIVVFIVQYVTR